MTVPAERPTQKIVSLLAAGTEILCGVGCGDRLVGVSHECDYPAEVARLPRLTRSRVDDTAASGQIDAQVRQAVAAGEGLYEIDLERLSVLVPELIVTQAQCDVCAVSLDSVMAVVRSNKRLRDTRVVALNPVTLHDIRRDIHRVGSAAGCDGGADKLISILDARVAAVADATRALRAAQRPRVACIEWIDPPMAAGNWMPEIIELAGGTQTLARPGGHSTVTPWAEFVAFDPQVVVVAPCGFDLQRTLAEMETLRALEGWSGLSAVGHHRVYAVDGNAYFNRSGPRIVDSLDILGHLLHPELIAAPKQISRDSTWKQVA